MIDSKVRTRFAPSPTGFMHIGNLRTALYAYLYARANNGQFVLRIEDTDRERYVNGAEALINRTLEASGIDYDEGPDKDGGVGPYIQSQRKDLYLKYAKELVERGHAYYCFCTKERLETLVDENGNRKYDGHCKSLTPEEVKAKLDAGEPYVIRQKIGEGVSEYDDMVYGHIAVDCADMEDEILIKSDGLPTYNFANVIDDHLMRITHVIRGTEYLSSTPKYNLIYDGFGWERPCYMHLPPIMKDATHKLSKRYGDANFEDFTARGFLPEAIVNYIALLGWSPKDNREKLSMEELKTLFNVEGITKSGSIFDEMKMKWLNGEYLKEMSTEEFFKVAEPFFKKSKVYGKFDLMLLSELVKTRVETLDEIPSIVDFLCEFGEYDTELFVHNKMKTDREIAKVVLDASLDVFKTTEWNADALHENLIALSEKLGMKKGQVLWSVRVALTGRASTPGGAIEMAMLLNRDESIRRIEFSRKLLGD